MRVDYNIGIDGWTEYLNGRIEISDHAWRILSKDTGYPKPPRVIPCQIGFTDTGQLLAVAKAIDAELEKEAASHHHTVVWEKPILAQIDPTNPYRFK